LDVVEMADIFPPGCLLPLSLAGLLVVMTFCMPYRNGISTAHLDIIESTEKKGEEGICTGVPLASSTKALVASTMTCPQGWGSGRQGAYNGEVQGTARCAFHDPSNERKSVGPSMRRL